MADVKETLRAYIEANATLLIGGVYLLRDLGNEFISPSNTPAVYSTNRVTIDPFAVLHFRTETSTSTFAPQERAIIALQLYEASGYTAIESTIATLKPLFQRGHRRLQGDDGTAFIRWVSAQSGLQTKEFQKASLALLTLEAYIHRS